MQGGQPDILINTAIVESSGIMFKVFFTNSLSAWVWEV